MKANSIKEQRTADEERRILIAYRRANEYTKRDVAKLLDVQRDRKGSFTRIK